MPLLASLHAWVPELILSLGGLVVVLLGAADRAGTILAGEEMPRTGGGAASTRSPWPARLTAVTLLLALDALLITPPQASSGLFFNLIIVDELAQVLRWLVLGMLALISLMVVSAHDIEDQWRGECLGLILLVGVGLMLMAQAQHLLMAYLAMELVSLTSYVLVGLTRDARSSEAALKYLLFGALSSGVMLFGMSLLFGMAGEGSFAGIGEVLPALVPGTHALVTASIVLILVGIAFKMSMVPFHLWTPDVYEGAPVAIAAMLSVGPKAAAVALLIRFAQALGPAWESIAPLIAALTIVTMVVGNVVAVVQQNVKRLLAYSTIGQVGYVLIGVVAGTALGLQAVLVYLTAYVVMNLGAFACVQAVCRETGSETLSAFRGLAKRSPMLALFLALFLLSLAGIPPLVGFIGKFLLLGAAIDSRALVLAITAAITSAIALYYYVAIIRKIYLEAPTASSSVRMSPGVQMAIGVCGAATVWLGVFPAALLRWFDAVATAFLR